MLKVLKEILHEKDLYSSIEIIVVFIAGIVLGALTVFMNIFM